MNPDTSPSPAARPQKARRRWLRRIAWAGAAFLLTWYALPWALPWPAALDQPVSGGVQITDRHGVPLRRLLADGKRAHGETALTAMPERLVQASLAAEDHRFERHGGVDWLATGRAVRDVLTHGHRVSGASTVTQQLVKLAEPRPRTLRTKVLEILTARRIEMTWDKPRILSAWLNRLDYGNLHLGPAAAADGYFSKPLADLSLAECAFLAGLPQAPTRLNPWRHFPAAKKRQEWILGRMEDLGWISQDEAGRARAEPLALRRHFGAFAAPHFVDLLMSRRPDAALAGTLTTTLDLGIQEHCEATIRDRLARLAPHHVSQAAAVVLDNETGDLLALVGSRDFDGPDGQVNGATARRSPGSALKPFTYLLALQEGQSPADIVPDLPVEFMTATGSYRPQNYNRRVSGPVSLRAALANSLNLPAVRVLEEHGGPEALVGILQAAGLTTLTRPAAEYGLGLTIGGGEVTLLELTAAYATLARMGVDRPVRMEAGDAAAERGRLFDPDACWLLADMLSDNDARTASFGTGSALRLPIPAAVKTGTSTDYRDNWTIGYTPRFTVGVWVGNFDSSPMRGVSGVTGAAPVFRDILTWLESRRPGPWYPRPEGILQVEVDPLTGLPVPERWAGKRPLVRESFRRDLAPAGPDPARYDAGGRVILPWEYRQWAAGPDNSLGASITVAVRPPDTPWRISNPLAGTILYLDPDLPGGGRRLPLRTRPPSRGVEWSSPTLTIEGSTALLTEGHHTLTARDPATGRSEETRIEVRKL